MFVIVSTYRARAGEEDALVALHEDLQRNRGMHCRDWISWELLRKLGNPHEFLVIAHFTNEESAQLATRTLERDGWYSRLESLTEGGQTRTKYVSVWQVHCDMV